MEGNNKASNYGTLAIIFISFITLAVQSVMTDTPVNIYSYIGLFLLIPSLILFTISRIQLGNSFQVSAGAHNLVNTGIYKKIRHPVYLFGSLFLLGVIIYLQLFYLLIIWIGIIFIQKARIKKEEKILYDKFGEHYTKYKKKTWF